MRSFSPPSRVFTRNSPAAPNFIAQNRIFREYRLNAANTNATGSADVNTVAAKVQLFSQITVGTTRHMAARIISAESALSDMC